MKRSDVCGQCLHYGPPTEPLRKLMKSRPWRYDDSSSENVEAEEFIRQGFRQGAIPEKEDEYKTDKIPF